MNKLNQAKTILLAGLIGSAISTTYAQLQASAQLQTAIPMDQLGTVAGKQYQGDGLAIWATPHGAKLRCVFQRLEGEATPDGLWLSSSAEGATGERFRVLAVAVGRTDDFGARRQSVATTTLFDNDWLATTDADFESGVVLGFPPQSKTLPVQGDVFVQERTARFVRPGLTEEYSVSMDGVRQDFVIPKRPVGDGKLRVGLEVTGALAEPWLNGVRLTLSGSQRKLAYTRMHVTDAGGRELTARIEVPSAERIAVVVDDANAVYPMRIDPTFSDDNWISMGGLPGADNKVKASVVDGAGNLYISGPFTTVGETTGTNYVAKWNGSSWSALGSGMNDQVLALAVSGSGLYAGGTFTTATNSGGVAVTVNGIAKWNGNSWSALGSGVGGGVFGNGLVFALVLSGSDLYAGGSFTTAGGIPANQIAKWNGNSWSALGSGIGSGIGDAVLALAVSGSDVYVGGMFTTAGGIPANMIAKWDGSSWSALDSGMNSSVLALAVSGSDVYAGGSFTTAGGTETYRIAKWDGSIWSPLDSKMNGTVRALAVSGSDLYAGGDFTALGAAFASFIAKWNGSSWNALGFSVDSSVYALAVSGSDVYAGGNFTFAGGTAANRIAKWDGSSWSALGSGMSSSVSALAMSGSTLYAGGLFKTPGETAATGGTAANYIGKWNGSNWSAQGSGMNGLVSALAISGNDVYAGGNFTFAGGIAANRIAKWNGSRWSALGSGLNAQVLALAVSGSNVYAGGRFTTTGGIGANYVVNYVAKWDGSSWSALGPGMINAVHALAVSGTDVYAGGDFGAAGGIGTNFVAKWNGSNWSALGSGMDSIVSALAVSGSDIYAGGEFTTAGGSAANYVAKWDGSSWSALGSGVSSYVQALAASGSDLYAGGRFTSAGGKVSGYAAQANIGGTYSPGQFGSLGFSPATGFSFTFSGGTVGESYRIQTSPSLAASPWADFTNFTYTVPIVITDSSAGSGSNKFFRVVSP